MNTTLQRIASKNNLQVRQITPLQGGSINEVFLLKCDTASFVIKLNDTDRFPNMFEREAKGLKLLKNSGSFKIPEVLSYGNEKNSSYLIMEYITKGTPTPDFWGRFALNLASLHKISNPLFGLDHDNYIGSLPQHNNFKTTASEFYITQRLEPQIRMATDKGFFIFSEDDRVFKNIAKEIPNEHPSLIHGDLWSGNYLVSEKKEPVLIDPAVAYAPREMDLGMMHLFGGFPQDVYSIYNEHFPLIENWEARIPIWQLYYLLVHLNLFGSGYFSQVNTIIKQYS